MLYCYAVTGSGGNLTRAAVELNKIRKGEITFVFYNGTEISVGA